MTIFVKKRRTHKYEIVKILAVHSIINNYKLQKKKKVNKKQSKPSMCPKDELLHEVEFHALINYSSNEMKIVKIQQNVFQSVDKETLKNYN